MHLEFLGGKVSHNTFKGLSKRFGKFGQFNANCVKVTHKTIKTQGSNQSIFESDIAYSLR